MSFVYPAQNNYKIMGTINCDIFKILVKCDCPVDRILKFAGLTTEKFFKYTRDDLTHILPGDVRQDVIDKIVEEIQKPETIKESQGIDQNVDDDDVQFLEEKTGAPVNKIKEELIFSDDDDQEGSPQNEDLLMPSSDDSSIEDDDEIMTGSGNDKLIVLNPRGPTLGFQKLKDDKGALVIISGQRGAHQCDRDDGSEGLWTQWTDGLAEWGSHIDTLRMTTWTWEPLTSSCPWNLFKILTQQCPIIQELSIEGPIHTQLQFWDQIPKFPLNFTLDKLKALIIRHKGDLTYKIQLKQILLAATNLLEIYLEYRILEGVNSFLKILKDLPHGQLKNLDTLSITSYHQKGHLKDTQIQMLALVEATSLKELELGAGLWEDVKGSSIEEILKKFQSSLKSFSLLGCFQGMNETKPEILINIPKMDKLKYIDLCGQYEYESNFEDTHPPKKIRKGSNGQRIINSGNLKTKPVPVTLKFPILPKLEQLDLSPWFKIEELHFSNFPNLENFHVGSRWDLSVKFPPEETSRRPSYPRLDSLQLPDYLDDPTFVQMIPQRFPNLKYCAIYLARVKVLRTFFNVMANSELEELSLCLQFDFGSTLDTCLLDKPSQVSLGEDEVRQISLLKEYERWEEFVKFNNIQLPPDDLSTLEEEGLAGLGSLKNLKTLVLGHHPRILRIPKGQFHWTDPECEFTREIIGFKWYTLSRSCDLLIHNLKNKGLIHDSYLNYENSFRVINQSETTGHVIRIHQSEVDGRMSRTKPEETNNDS